MPVTPKLVIELGGHDLRHATSIGGWLAFSFALAQFLFSPVMGNLSDAYGRRPIILAATLGSALEFWAMAVAPNLAWLFVARILSGLTGASNAPAQSSIADLATPEDRARLFGLLGAAFGIGFVVGPALGGLLGEFGSRIPFYAAAGLISCNLVYGILKCQETLSPESRRPFDWRRANPLGAFLEARKLHGVLGLALVYFLWQMSSLVYPLIWPYFTIARWHWSPGIIGLSLAGVGICMALVNAVIGPRLVRRLGERRTALLGIAVATLTMAAYAFAPRGWIAFVLLPVMAFQAIVHPSLTALFSRRGQADTQGEIQGFASSIMALGSLTAPALYFPLQSWFTGPGAPVHFDGAALLAASIIGGVGCLLLAGQRSTMAVQSNVIRS